MTQKLHTEVSVLRLFVCFSGSASAVQYLQKADPDWQRTYSVIGAFTDDHDARAKKIFRGTPYLLPCHCTDWDTFHPEIQSGAREKKFFSVVAEIIELHDPDCIIFSGFMRIVPDWFIDRFEERIINVHPTDLSIIDSNGKRKYTGIGRGAIQSVLDDGLTTIRSTIHFVEKGEPDTGRIIAQSEPVAILPNESAKDLQERLKEKGEGPALKKAIEILCNQRISETV